MILISAEKTQGRLILNTLTFYLTHKYILKETYLRFS